MYFAATFILFFGGDLYFSIDTAQRTVSISSLPTHTYNYSFPSIWPLRIELACMQERSDAFKKSGDYCSGFSSLSQEEGVHCVPLWGAVRAG